MVTTLFPILLALVAITQAALTATQLEAAAAKALQQLKSYYKSNSDGAWPQDQTAWWQSATAYSAYLDYQRWTGDTQFASFVADGLTALSNGGKENFLDSTSQIKGVWNDDIEWGAQAYVAGSEVAGWATRVPATTLQETWAQSDSKCGGGIYWARERSQNNYKSIITNLEYIQTAARLYHLNKDASLIANSKTLIAWLKSTLWHADGTLNDGLEGLNCGKVTTLQWSYSYGELIGGLAFLNKATGDASYLFDASTVLNKAVATFAPSGVITELCESSGCNRDQKVFKGIFARNLAYLYRQTTITADKTTITRVLDSSVASLASTCGSDWNCGDVQLQQVAASTLIGALGVHSTKGGSGLYTSFTQSKKKRKSKKRGPKRLKD